MAFIDPIVIADAMPGALTKASRKLSASAYFTSQAAN